MAARAGGVRAAEARVLRRTRLKLVAWSAGSTFLVLVAMGGVLYAATARFLEADSEAMLRARADTFMIGSLAIAGRTVTVDGSEDQAPMPGQPVMTTTSVDGTVTVEPAPFSASYSVVTDPGVPGMVVGGITSGTIAVALPDTAVAAFDPALPVPQGAALDAAGFVEARTGTMVINELSVLGAPMRVLSMPVADEIRPFVIQVAGDRTAELRTLEGLTIILGVAGAAAVVVAAVFGWLYAGRALVPVRESLRRQRELAADASHELRTPLAVIRGNLELLRARRAWAAVDERDVRGATEPDPLDEIDAEVGRLSGLVDQLLLLARADSDALEVVRRPADLGAEAADALDALTPVAAARDVALTLDVEPVPVQGDPERLRQLAAILIDNAIRHAPAGGHVEVVARAHGGHATLAVTDDGPGIRAEDLPHVFDRFWRAPDAPAGGSGLGLAIASWVAEQHDGTITAGTLPTGGARFEVRLPLGG